MEYENIGKSLAGTEWGQTKGAETLNNIIKANLLQHYDKRKFDIKLLLLKYTGLAPAEIAVVEVEPLDTGRGYVMGVGSKYWTFKSRSLGKSDNSLVAICKIENLMVIMGGEEFFDLWENLE